MEDNNDPVENGGIYRGRFEVFVQKRSEGVQKGSPIKRFLFPIPFSGHTGVVQCCETAQTSPIIKLGHGKILPVLKSSGSHRDSFENLIILLVNTIYCFQNLTNAPP